MEHESKDVDSIVKSLTDKTIMEVNESRKKVIEMFYNHLEKDYKRNKEKAKTIKRIKRTIEFSTSLIGVVGAIGSTSLFTLVPILTPLVGSIVIVGSALEAFIGLLGSKLGLSSVHARFTKKADLYRTYMDKVDLFYKKSMKDGILSDKEYEEYLSIDEEFKNVLKRLKKGVEADIPSNAFTDEEIEEYVKEGKEQARKELKDVIIEKAKHQVVLAETGKKKF